MSKKRINISIDRKRLEDLDFYASVNGVNRSQAIEDLIVVANSDLTDCERYQRKLNLISICMDGIIEEIEACDTYEEKESKKRDAFYELVGCIRAVIS